MSRQTTNYGLTKPDYTDTADIEVVNANMDIIDGALKVIDTKSNNVMSKNSSAWSSTVTYAVGQYCIYNNSLWKSLVQHSGQTPQEGTYWARVSLDTLGSEISAINQNISNNDIEIVFNYLAIEFTIFRKSGIYYLHCGGRLTEDFPTDWTTIAQVPNLQYKGIGHIVTNSTGTPIKIAYNNGELRVLATKSGTKNEYVQDSCIII